MSISTGASARFGSAALSSGVSTPTGLSSLPGATYALGLSPIGVDTFQRFGGGSREHLTQHTVESFAKGNAATGQMLNETRVSGSTSQQPEAPREETAAKPSTADVVARFAQGDANAGKQANQGRLSG
ncbi:MAG: hypothetical protein SFZ03_01460 [Candidatus Melainabacteria bacterium]|nr:hypothetical protein [Candidatus Melainabacteria bacterium]